MTLGVAYFDAVEELVRDLREHEYERMKEAAGWIAQSMTEGGILHIFGSGHSALPAKDIFIRAGSLSNVRAVAVDQDLDWVERVPGVAEHLLESYDLRPNEVMIVISNSGINPLPIEVATIAHDQGLKTVALTSLGHSERSESRDPKGRKLFEVVDVAIDTHVPYGDASLEVEGLPMRIGPLSTLSGLVIVHTIVVETIDELRRQGMTPPVRISRNTPEGDKHNARFHELYGDRIPEL